MTHQATNTSVEIPEQQNAPTIPPDQDYSTPSNNYLRLGYLSIFGGLSAFFPFASVLYESKGLSPSENGLLLAFSPLCLLFVIPPVAYWAETNGLQTKIMYFSGFVSMILLVCVFVVEDKLAVIILTLFYFIINAPLFPLYDEHALSVLGDENKQYYGGFRVMGAYSWLVGSLVSSAILNYVGGWRLLTIPVVLGSLGHLYSVYKTPVEKEIGEHHYWDVWAHIFKNPPILNFIFGISFIGFGYSIISTFLNLFLVGPELQAPPILLGLCTVMTVSIEIPIFRSAEWLHKNFTDEQLFVGSVLGYIFRVWGYSLLPNCWLVLLLEPLHGVTFGLMWLSAMSFFKKSFPKQLANSAVGFVYSSVYGIGPLAGNVFGGLIYERYGPRNLFRISGTIILVVGVIFWFNHRRFVENEEIEKERKKKIEEEEMERNENRNKIVGETVQD